MAATKTQATLRQKLDRFWSVLFLTEEGRPKSATLLYSFCLALVFTVIYGVSYWFLIDLIQAAFPAGMQDVLQIVLPGLAGSVVCCATFFLPKPNKRGVVASAYIWMTLLAIAIVVCMAFLTDKESFSIFISIFLKLVTVPLLTGASFTHFLLRRIRKRQAAEQERFAHAAH